MKYTLAALLVASTAFADEEPVPASVAPTPEELAKRIEALEERADKVEELEQRISTLNEQVAKVAPLRRFITVFLDVGWFSVGGNGAGVRSDTGHRYVPDHGGVPAEWVLIGDPLSTTINSLGEPADLGVARAIEDDTIDSDGNPTFLVNAVGLSIGRSLPKNFAVSALVELLPRTGPDVIVVESARVDYRPATKIKNFVLSAGKVESVLGIEYRAQDAVDRLGITPSLLCRYTCGRPYGVRAHLEHDAIDLSALVASGDTFQERFEQDPRLASAKAPTVSAHAQYLVPIANGIKVGVSGAFGPQDGQSKSRIHQWHYGFDLFVRAVHKLELQAEFVQGKQQGSSTALSTQLDVMPGIVEPRCSLAQCLRYKAAYGLASYRATRRFTPYARVDWRDARHQYGVDFLYVSRVVRGTVGAQFAVTPRILGKIEYTYNHELLGPQFPNDVLTTSIVISTGE
ncbi:MAG: hypothetical protein M4D80_00565 [Myxococcota bacterium]|nr:hypothetical protein [Myxococcota bacterium]